MTSVKWKRKQPACVSSSSAPVFLNEDDSEEEERGFVDDWKLLIPSNKKIMLEDSITKSKRLVQEATILAEETRLVYSTNFTDMHFFNPDFRQSTIDNWRKVALAYKSCHVSIHVCKKCEKEMNKFFNKTTFECNKTYRPCLLYTSPSPRDS